MTEFLEYVWCMDTQNREKKAGECKDPNPTNPVTVPANLSVTRLAVEAIELATLEVPRNQRLIEPEWNRVYYYAGFSPPESGTLVIHDCCFEYTASLPRAQIPIVGASSGMGGTIFTTSEPHLIEENLKAWPAKPQEQPEVLGFDEGLPLHGAKVISPTEFWLPVTVSGNKGTLWWPPLATPASIAEVITKQLNASFIEAAGVKTRCNVFRMHYDVKTSRLTLSLTPAAIQTCELDFLQRAQLLVKSTTNLGALLGFTTGSHTLCPGGTGAGSPPYGTFYVTLPSGDYMDLADVVGATCGGLYFLGTPMFTLVSNLGQAFQIQIATGAYTGPGLAEEMTEKMHEAWPEGAVDVTYDEKDGFTFTSDLTFGLDFTPTQSNMSYQLGFECFPFTGKTSYTSTRIVNAAQFNVGPCYIPQPRFSLNACYVKTDAGHYVFYNSAPPPLPAASTTVEEVGDTLVVSNPKQTHGLQVGDVALFEIGSEIYRLPVIEVLSPTDVVVSLGSLGGTFPLAETTGALTATVDPKVWVLTGEVPSSIGSEVVVRCGTNTTGTIATVTAVGGGSTTLTFPNDFAGCGTDDATVQVAVGFQSGLAPTISFLSSGNNPCAIKPQLLGFCTEDMLWDGQNVVTAPYQYKLQAFSYILLEMTYPCGGSSRIEQGIGGSNNTSIVGKIVTLRDPILDRFYPLRTTFYTPIRLTKVTFRLINPDGTLYRLGGQDWACTLRLFSPNCNRSTLIDLGCAPK